MSSESSTSRKVVIVGGVAGGATVAARLRRLDEQARIVVLERGPHVSFANCGLPYHVGGVIPNESDLLLASPEFLAARFSLDVRTGHEVLGIDRAAKTVRVREVATGREYDEPYGKLVLSPGAAPLVPPMPGVDLPGIFTVRNVPDARRIKERIAATGARRAVIVGAGFIGIEIAENLAHLGLSVTLVELQDQVLPPFDPEMARYLEDVLVSRGIEVVRKHSAAGFERDGDALRVRLDDGRTLSADLAVLAIGVRPETRLARDAGLEIGARGGIRVDAQMRTTDPDILAVGDAVEVPDRLTGAPTLLALAGPAQRQARVAADTIVGRSRSFKGVQGTAVVEAFGLVSAMTGQSEKALRRAGNKRYAKVYLHPYNHVTYYPGAKPLHMKLLFDTADGRILGAQAVGESDVARRIDVIAAFIQMGGTIHDLEDAELAYSPQIGSAKDPVNLAGMVAANHLRGDLPLADWDAVLSGTGDSLLVDVRTPAEYAEGHIPGAVNIPLHALRGRLGELPAGKPLIVYCGVGLRAYVAVRILLQRGHAASNLSGGWDTWRTFARP